ncbi:MAG TPA: hypothetical protein VI548_08450 [Chitinophagaceae bacterium]|nr:hypothetical protein [Chitinophagaceae bacterium]
MVRCATNLKNISSLKCCTKDGGRPSAIGMQMQIANHPQPWFVSVVSEGSPVVAPRNRISKQVMRQVRGDK